MIMGRLIVKNIICENCGKILSHKDSVVMGGNVREEYICVSCDYVIVVNMVFDK